MLWLAGLAAVGAWTLATWSMRWRLGKGTLRNAIPVILVILVATAIALWVEHLSLTQVLIAAAGGGVVTAALLRFSHVAPSLTIMGSPPPGGWDESDEKLDTALFIAGGVCLLVLFAYVAFSN